MDVSGEVAEQESRVRGGTHHTGDGGSLTGREETEDQGRGSNDGDDLGSRGSETGEDTDLNSEGSEVGETAKRVGGDEEASLSHVLPADVVGEPESAKDLLVVCLSSDGGQG